MRRPILAALAGIALLFAGSIGLIVAMDRMGRGEPPAHPPAPIAPARAAATPAPPRDTGAASAAPTFPAARHEDPAMDEAPAMALPRDPAERLRALQPLQREVRAGLDELELRTGCVLRDVMLALTLETGDREVRIAEAVARPRGVEPEVDSEPEGGEADEAVARCVHDRIRGMALPAPSARAGRRWEMLYTPPSRRR